MAERGRPKTSQKKSETKAESYRYPEAESPLRPEAGTQAQFKKKLPPAAYRYDSSLSPSMEWDGENGKRELGEWLLVCITDAVKLGTPFVFEKPREFKLNDGKTIATVRGLEDAAEQLAAIGKPFLNWSGKAERLSFDVPTLPLFVHERLSTSSIIETLKSHKVPQVEQYELFGDPRHSITDQVLRAYEYKDKWVNRMVLGDSLVVMNSLLRYEGLGGQVQTIYMDPPYGVKFGSNFQPFVRKRDVKHNEDDDLTREPEMVKAYRDTWELGLHSYLTYMRDRLLLARDLLTPSGSIFVQISDENLHHVRELMDEVFGEENFVSLIAFRKTSAVSSPHASLNTLASAYDYLIWYAKDLRYIKYNQLYKQKQSGDEGATAYKPISDLPVSTNLGWEKNRLATSADLTSQGESNNSEQEFVFDGRVFRPPRGLHWKTTVAGLERLAKLKRIFLVGNTLRYLRLMDDFPAFPISNSWTDTGIAGFTADKIYVVQTTPKVIERCILMTTDPGDLVLDPTCGSGTTAYVAEQWGRRWITIDTSRVPMALARQRILTATFPWYDLKEEERGPVGGFVYKRRQNSKGEEVGGIVPHVTLKSIANDDPPQEEVLVDRPEMKSGIVRVSGPFVVEATIPTPLDWENGEAEDSGATITENHGSFIERMLEVLRRSPVLQLGGGKTVTLNNVRPPAKTLVLSAEAIVELAVDSEKWIEEKDEGSIVSRSDSMAKSDGTRDVDLPGDKGISQRGNLRVDESVAKGGGISTEQHRGRAGEIDNGRVPPIPGVLERIADGGGNTTLGSEKLRVSSESVRGGFTKSSLGDGANSERSDFLSQKITDITSPLSTNNFSLTTKLVAIVFGPENGAVSEKLVYEAAREAYAKSYNHLYVIGFAIQPDARKLIESSEAVVGINSTYVQATPDLMMGDLLKNMRSSQIFSVCGLPDIRISRIIPEKAGDAMRYAVELKGLDVFDPATMETLPLKADDVPAWFLDTDYNELCFHVCQAFFPRTSAWEGLKKALKGTYEESVWDHLSGVVSAPFEAGENGKIAVKVIDDRGNELMVVRSLVEAEK